MKTETLGVVGLVEIDGVAITDPRLIEDDLYVGISPHLRATMIRSVKERPLYVNQEGVWFSFPDPNRAYAIQKKNGGMVFPPLVGPRA